MMMDVYQDLNIINYCFSVSYSDVDEKKIIVMKCEKMQ
jgi:hypothetical protein